VITEGQPLGRIVLGAATLEMAANPVFSTQHQLRRSNMKINKRSLKYMSKNWKMVVHLLLRTKYFGVDNQWWGKGPCRSLFGVSTFRIILDIVLVYPIFDNYRRMKYRAGTGFIPKEDYEAIWGELYLS